MNETIPIGETAAEVPAEAAASAEASAKRGNAGLTIAKNSFWLLVDSAVGMAAQLYCSIVVARSLGPDRMGEYNYIIWFATVLRMVSEVAIPVTVRKFAAELMGREDYGALKTVVRLAFRLQTKLAFVGAALGLVFVYLFIPHNQRSFATLAVISVIPALMVSIPAGALWATENLRHNVMGSLGGVTVNLVGVTVAVVLRLGLLGLVASFLLSRIVDCILRFILFRRQYARLPGGRGEGELDPALRKRMVRFAVRQLLLIGFQVLLFERMEVFFLKGLAETREIAFFSLSFTLVQYVFVLPAVLAQSAGATLFVQQGRAPNEVARMATVMTWFMLLVAAPTYFGLAALSDPLFRMLYGSKYLAAIPVLTALSLFGVCRALMGPTEQVLIATERQVFFITSASAAALIDVVANLVLIPRLGALGAALAKGGSQIFLTAAFLTFMVWQFRVKLPFGRMARLLLACTAMFFGVRLVGRPLGSLPALLVGVPVGIAIFAFLARLLRCLDAADGERLRQLRRLLPAGARRPYVALVDFLVPV